MNLFILSLLCKFELGLWIGLRIFTIFIINNDFCISFFIVSFFPKTIKD